MGKGIVQGIVESLEQANNLASVKMTAVLKHGAAENALLRFL
jgi:hypothetical protein